MVSMPQPSGDHRHTSLARLVRQTREACALSEQELAEPQFTAGYIAALEQSAVIPSRLTQEYLAPRLGLSLDDFQKASQELETIVDLGAIAEDLRYQVNYVLMLIRSGSTDAALQRIGEAEDYARPFLADLPAGVRYLIPFVRARAYYQRTELTRAQAELESALQIADSDEEAAANVRNLLGAVLCLLEQPELALREHHRCQTAIRSGAIKDLNLRVSVYRNLALDYWALNDLSQAIGAYQEALVILKDLGDSERQAAVFWGLLMAHRATGEHAQAILYGMRAMQSYEDLDHNDEAAGVCLNLAEILLEESRYPEAEQMLQKAKWLSRQTEDAGLLSFLYGDLADLALRQARLDQATQYAAESIKFAEANCRIPESGGKQPREYPARTYAEALQVAALVQEARGNTEATDQLFERALAQIDQTAFDETAQAIRLSYADLLRERGAFKRSAEYYRLLAQSRPRSRQGRLY